MAELQALFLASVAGNGTRTDGDSPIHSTLLSAIGSAETSVAITIAYFVPDAQLLAALSGAAQHVRRRSAPVRPGAAARVASAGMVAAH